MDETRFYYSTDGTDSLGPVTPSELRELYEKRVLTEDSFLCREGESSWEPFSLGSLPALKPAPAPTPAPTQSLKTLTKNLPDVQAGSRAETKPRTDFKSRQSAQPAQSKQSLQPAQFTPAKQPQQIKPASVAVEPDDVAGDTWETNQVKLIAWGLCGFVAFDTALFLTWQRPAGTPHSMVSTVLFFVGEIFFVLVIPFLISLVIPRPWRYRGLTGLTVLLALIFIGLRFALPSGTSASAVASTATPSTNATPSAPAAPLALPSTNATAEIETSSSSTNAASLAPPPEVPSTNAPSATASTTNAAPVTPSVPPTADVTPAVPPTPPAPPAPPVAIIPAPATNATPAPAPPPPPPVDPAAVARDVQQVNDTLLEKTKAAGSAEAACPNFNPTTITTHENVAQRQAAITAWQTTQNDVLTYLQGYDSHVRDALAHENLSQKDLDDAVADAHKKAQVDQLISLWQLKIKLSSDHLARLLFLDKAWDHWSGKTGKLVFDDQSVLDDYNKLLSPLQEDVKGITDIEKQLTQ